MGKGEAMLEHLPLPLATHAQPIPPLLFQPIYRGASNCCQSACAAAHPMMSFLLSPLYTGTRLKGLADMMASTVESSSF